MPPQRRDYTGQVFGRLNLLAFEEMDKNFCQMYTAVCKCGVQKIVNLSHLKSRSVVSCGCRQQETLKLRTKHGYSSRHGDRLEYSSWQHLKGRCLNPHNDRFELYGGRGIKVCKRWLGPKGFLNFVRDMGPVPEGCNSIDRINNDGNYTPSNCRWATREMQHNNQRHHNRFTKGETR